jgi:CheY-like chemotaxis protein
MDEPVFLYVEDDLLSRKVVDTILTRVMKFANLTVFEDSCDFAQRLQNLPNVPDIIFLDIQIGPIDGYKMLQVIRSLADYEDAVVIAMTANVMSHDVEQLKQAGFNGLVGKPLLSHVFPKLVEKIIANESVWFVP